MLPCRLKSNTFIRLDDEDQLVTDTADLKMTEDALAEDTVAFEDTMQDCLAIQTKSRRFRRPHQQESV